MGGRGMRRIALAVSVAVVTAIGLTGPVRAQAASADPSLATRSTLLRAALVTDQLDGSISSSGVLNSLQVKLDGAPQNGLTPFANEVEAQRGVHVSVPAAGVLLAEATGPLSSSGTLGSAGGIVTASAPSPGTSGTTVAAAAVVVPTGTAVSTVKVTPPPAPVAVAPPSGEAALGGYVITAFSTQGSRLTDFSSTPLVVSLTAPANPRIVASKSEIDTVDPVTHGLQRLPTRVSVAADGTITATAQTTHLTPFGLSAPLSPGYITTLAGGPGQGTATIIAQHPAAVAVTGSTVYVADSQRHVVRALDLTSATETVVAGTGLTGDSGDGGLATAATLTDPEGVAVDGAGDIYIADAGTGRVRKVDPSGTISGYAGVGSTAPTAGTSLPALNALLSLPEGLATDGSGGLYVADPAAGHVLYVSPAGTLSVFAGGGAGPGNGDGGAASQSVLVYPTDVAVDGAGDVFITDPQTLSVCDAGPAAAIRMVDPAGTIQTVFSGSFVPGTGIGTNSVAVDSAGDLFAGSSCPGAEDITELPRTNPGLTGVDPTFGSATVVAGTPGSTVDGYGGDGGPATSALLSQPQGVAVDSGGDLLIADTNNGLVREVGAGTGIINTVAGLVDVSGAGLGGPLSGLQLGSATAAAYGPDGTVYLADALGYRVLADGPTTDSVRAVSALNTQLVNPQQSMLARMHHQSKPITTLTAVATDASGDLFAATESDGHVREVTPAGVVSVLPGVGETSVDTQHNVSSGPTVFNSPVALAVDGAGDVFVADQSPGTIWKVAPGATTARLVGQGFNQPSGLAVSGSLLYVSEPGAQVVESLDLATGARTVVAGQRNQSGYQAGPAPAVQTPLSNPSDVAVDGSGRILVLDQSGTVVRRVDPSTGTISTVAGNATPGFSGDGGPAAAAQLDAGYQTTVAGHAAHLALDSAGDLVVGDNLNNRFRVVAAGF